MSRFLVAWLVLTTACWSVLAVLTAALVPGGFLTIALLALLLSAPILVLLRGFARETYPRRSVRLFVIRPFWYVQLVLPVAAIAAVTGMVAGLVAGVFAIPGNHDVYAGWGEVRRGLEAQGITVLVNAAVALSRGGEHITLLGTGDPAGRHWHRDGGDAAAPDLGRALADARRVSADGAPIIALAHNPVLWPALAAAGAALTLSGHTHWGQLAVPRLGWSLASTFLEHSMGVYVRGRRSSTCIQGQTSGGCPSASARPRK